jgi:hypothetical protein
MLRDNADKSRRKQPMTVCSDVDLQERYEVSNICQVVENGHRIHYSKVVNRLPSTCWPGKTNERATFVMCSVHTREQMNTYVKRFSNAWVNLLSRTKQR